MLRLRRTVLAAPLLAVALLAGGCSAGAVSQSDLETEVARDEEGVTGVECEGELAGEVDATQNCTATFDDGTTVDVVVRVTEVDGDTINFEVEVPE